MNREAEAICGQTANDGLEFLFRASKGYGPRIPNENVETAYFGELHKMQRLFRGT